MIPDADDPCWSRVLSSDQDLAGTSLATRFLIARLRSEVKRAPTQLAESVAELRSFMVKNRIATADLAKF